MLGGAALTGGYWFLQMWQRFGNPLFPYFNEFFQSPWATIGSYRDGRFIPQGLSEWLLFPFHFAIDPLQVGEVPFQDLRLALLYVLLVPWLAKLGHSWLSARGRHHRDAQSRPDELSATGFLVVFVVVAFVLWMTLFAVYRYLMVVEMLAPLLTLLLLGALVPDERVRRWVALGAFGVLLGTVQPGDWGRRPWGEDYFGVEAPPVSQPEQTLVLMAGYDPTAYMIPFFPPQVRFLRLQGYFTGPSPLPNRTDRLMHAIVAGHGGPQFMLYRAPEEWLALAAADAYGLQIERSSCSRITPAVEPRAAPFLFCEVRKRSPDDPRARGS